MIGVIADDFTGAAELGAIGLRHGLRAEVLCFDALPGAEFRDVDLVCVSTGSRHCRPSLAARRAASAARALRERGAERIYKKVDSVLRGPVTAEVDAVRDALGLERVLLVPANPSAGRVVAAGQYLVQGTPLDQTDFRHDPEHPRRTASVAELLRRRGGPRVEIRERKSDPATLARSGIIVGEAARPSDVRRWVRALDDVTLPAGAAEFFSAWLKAIGFRRVPGMVDILPHGRELFVCGSASAATREFVAEQRRKGVPVLRPAAAVAETARLLRRARAALLQQGRVVLASPAVAIRDRRHARRVTEQLVALAAALLRTTEVERVFAEGGETAAALARRLGWTRLRVVTEVSPGVVALSPSSNWPGVLVVKPGSYRWPRSISESIAPESD